MRKIIQISAVQENKYHNRIVYALCDDGTFWSYVPEAKKWEFKDQIPQDPQPELSFVEQRDRIAKVLDRRES